MSDEPRIKTAQRKPARAGRTVKPGKTDTTRRTRITVVAAALLPSLGLLAWTQIPGRSLPDKGGVPTAIDKAGYTELTPPSRLFGPGTISTVETLPDGSLRLHLTCNMDEDALAKLRRQSPTVDQSEVESVRSRYDASARAFSVVAANATDNQVKRVAFSLRDMHVVTMPDEILYQIRKQYLQGDCQAVIVGNLSAGAKVCQTADVLQADIALSMDFSDKVSVAERAALEQKALGSIELDFDGTRLASMQGDDLYLGVNQIRNCFILNKDGQPIAGI